MPTEYERAAEKARADAAWSLERALAACFEAGMLALSPETAQRHRDALDKDPDRDFRIVAYMKAGIVDMRLVTTTLEIPLPDDEGSDIVARLEFSEPR